MKSLLNVVLACWVRDGFDRQTSTGSAFNIPAIAVRSDSCPGTPFGHRLQMLVSFRTFWQVLRSLTVRQIEELFRFAIVFAGREMFEIRIVETNLIGLLPLKAPILGKSHWPLGDAALSSPGRFQDDAMTKRNLGHSSAQGIVIQLRVAPGYFQPLVSQEFATINDDMQMWVIAISVEGRKIVVLTSPSPDPNVSAAHSRLAA